MDDELLQRTSNFDTDRHALYVGWVCALALRNGLRAVSVKDGDGNYTDRIIVTIESGVGIELIVPPPPDDWTLM